MVDLLLHGKPLSVESTETTSDTVRNLKEEVSLCWDVLVSCQLLSFAGQQLSVDAPVPSEGSWTCR